MEQQNFNYFHSSEPNPERKEENLSHFPVVAIIGACAGILIPIIGIICGIISLSNCWQQEGISQREKRSNILFSILLISCCAISQILVMVNGINSNLSSSPTSDEEALLHFLMPLLF